MSYTPTEWETADIVTAQRMNALETAVGDMNMSYTPNTWSDGDILSAEKMNALEQAVASGGGSWTVLTEESVTTEQRGLGVVGNLAYSEKITADTIKVTFNGTEYTCTKTADGDSNYYGAEWSDGYDFSTYPFAIDSNSSLGNAIFAETAGTYSIKIEAPQSGGSSDFSTATVTVAISRGTPSFSGVFILPTGEPTHPYYMTYGEQNFYDGDNFQTVLYDNESFIEIELLGGQGTPLSVIGTGNVEIDIESSYAYAYITGDCTITIS